MFSSLDPICFRVWLDICSDCVREVTDDFQRRIRVAFFLPIRVNIDNQVSTRYSNKYKDHKR